MIFWRLEGVLRRLLCHFIHSKHANLTPEKIEMVQALSKKSDIYERLARAIGELLIRY